MSVDLFRHNEESYENIKEQFKTNNRTCVIQPTGSGKSFLILKLIEDYMALIRDVIIIEPQKYILNQLIEKMDKYGLLGNNVKFLTYSALGKIDDEKLQEYNSPAIVLVDEMHRAGAKTWESGLRKMFDWFPDDCKYVGFSATPIRFLDGKRDMCKELFNGCVANEIGLADAILNRILPLPRYIAGLYTYDNEVNAINRKIMQSCNNEEEKKELLEEVKIMKNNLDKSNGISDIFKKYIERNKGKYIAFCRNIAHLKLMKPCLEKWFSEAGMKVNLYEVHCRNPEKDKEFKSFMDDDGLSVCLSVGILSEGIHGIDGVILLRDTISPNLYLQQLGRCFSVDMKSIPIIFDLVANCESIMDCSLKDDLLNAVDRRDKDDKKKDIEDGNGKEKDGSIDRKKITRDDIEKFFVFDQVLDSVSAFRNIEGRLKDSWSLYVKALEQYKAREGDCLVPGRHVEILNSETKLRLGEWVNNIRQSKKGKVKYRLTSDRLKQLDDLGFIWETKKESMFDKFFRYALQYKKKYGHLNIKYSDIIDGYNIGTIHSLLFNEYKKGKLSNEQITKLRDIGINICVVKYEQQFQRKMNLARQAVNEGVIISNTNQIYCNVNLYSWHKTNIDKFTSEEVEIINRLIPKNCARKIVIINIKDGQIKTFSSISEAGRALYNDFHLVNTEKSGRSIITNRLTGHIKNPVYKGLRFEYVDEKPLKEKSPTIKKISL